MQVYHKHRTEDKYLAISIFFDPKHGGDEDNEFINSFHPDVKAPLTDMIYL